MSSPAQNTSRGGTTPKAIQGLNGSSPSAEFAPQAGSDFVITPSIQDLTDRALAYLGIGYAVHLSGPAGTGKTTLALHIASQLGRRCTLLHGDDELRASDLIGKDSGFRRQSIRDNYVSSILKTEETVSLMWTSNRLTTACEQGHTLIYDEFTRTPATANNAFLSILEEGILNIPSSSQEKGYIRVHQDFRAIFTSNPEEYVGVHKTQDALLDRMITLEVTHQDRETEISILVAKSKRSKEEATLIIDIVRRLRDRLGGSGGPTIRAAIAIARIIDLRQCAVDTNDPTFMATCQDVLYFNAKKQNGGKFDRNEINSIVNAVMSSGSTVVRPSERQPNKKMELPKTGIARIAVAGTDSVIDHFSQVENLVAESVDESLVSQERTSSSSTPMMNDRRLPRPPAFDLHVKTPGETERSLETAIN